MDLHFYTNFIYTNLSKTSPLWTDDMWWNYRLSTYHKRRYTQNGLRRIYLKELSDGHDDDDDDDDDDYYDNNGNNTRNFSFIYVHVARFTRRVLYTYIATKYSVE